MLTREHLRPSDRRIAPALLVVLAAVAVLWRLLAYRFPSSFVPVADGLRLPLAALGLFFAACAVVAYLRRGGRTITPFVLYGLGGGIHWGGAVGAAGDGAELSLLFLYLAASALSEGALLHLALVWPPAWRAGRAWLGALYLPAGLAAAMAPLAGWLPRAALEPAVGALLVVANLLGIASGLVFIVRLIRADRGSRDAAGLALIVPAMLLAVLLSTLGGAGILPGTGEAYSLAHAAVPAALFRALMRRHDAAAGH